LNYPNPHAKLAGLKYPIHSKNHFCFALMNQSLKLSKPLSIWAFTDNKPGHRNQLEGLINALSERRALTTTWMSVNTQQHSLLKTLIKAYHHFKIQRPDLIIGAGHRTHFYLLICRLLYGGKTIVLMKPSLPLSKFDLVLIPEHDGEFSVTNVISTQGVINKIKPAPNPDPLKGLFLIGGPSKHHLWDSRQVAAQIATIAEAQPQIQWQLATSRRTPPDFAQHIKNIGTTITITLHSEADSGWLPRQLSNCSHVWVTQDSVSMIYEALTSGAHTGILEIPALHSNSRVQHGINLLLKNKALFSYSDWVENTKQNLSPVKFNEADRCADLILSHFNYVR